MSLTTGASDRADIVPRLATQDSFRTLGVYISPSGSQRKQMEILCDHTQNYFDYIKSSVLTEYEAYLSYMLYLRPKIVHPLPCSSLTPEQCRHIQAPALAGLLPKLHLNRHTPHAILFAGSRYGGLNLPELYTDQGISQIQYLVGHLHLEDGIGLQILCLISHTQLHVSSAKHLFNLPFSAYSKWIDHTWITSVWQFLAAIVATLNVQKHWVPPLPRMGDRMLMDIALDLGLPPVSLRKINNCRLYLQVLTVSDISTADGRYLLPSAIEGHTEQALFYGPIVVDPRSGILGNFYLTISHKSAG
jgi:hypothetical protein